MDDKSHNESGMNREEGFHSNFVAIQSRLFDLAVTLSRGDEGAAQSLVDHARSRAERAWGQFDGSRSMLNWTTRVLVNSHLYALRSAPHGAEEPLPVPASDGLFALGDRFHGLVNDLHHLHTRIRMEKG